MTRYLLTLSLLSHLLLASFAQAQNIPGSTNILGVGGKQLSGANVIDPSNSAVRINCVVGCGGIGTQDVNVLQLLGASPSVTNPFPHRLSTGTAFYDARDRNWALSSGTDSVNVGNFPATQAVTQSGVWNIGTVTTLTGVTNPVAVTGTFWQATQPVSGTVTVTDGAGALNVIVDSGTVAATQSGNWSSRTQAGDGTSIGSGGTGTGLTVTCTNCGGSVTPATYTYIVPSAAVGANKVFLDCFNATGSGKVMKLLGVYPKVDTDTAVVGALGIETILMRTSAVGTGGTAGNFESATISVAGGNIYRHDSNDSTLPAQVTCRHLLTGGGTNAIWMRTVWVAGEETATSWAYGAQGQLNMVNNLDGDKDITIRENQGFKLLQGAVAATGNIAFRIVFTLE